MHFVYVSWCGPERENKQRADIFFTSKQSIAGVCTYRGKMYHLTSGKFNSKYEIYYGYLPKLTTLKRIQ